MVPAFRTCTRKGPSENKGQVSQTSVRKIREEEKGNIVIPSPSNMWSLSRGRVTKAKGESGLTAD